MDKNSLPEAIAKRIKDLRENHGETQIQLAEAIKCNQNTVSKIENGKSLTAENLLAIATHYNVSMDYLCKGENEVDIIEILTKYLKYKFTKYSGNSNNYPECSIPTIQINQSLYELIIQIAKANSDIRISEELKDKWVAIEIEKFKSRIHFETEDDYISVIPINETTATNNPEILTFISQYEID